MGASAPLGSTDRRYQAGLHARDRMLSEATRSVPLGLLMSRTSPRARVGQKPEPEGLAPTPDRVGPLWVQTRVCTGEALGQLSLTRALPRAMSFLLCFNEVLPHSTLAKQLSGQFCLGALPNRCGVRTLGRSLSQVGVFKGSRETHVHTTVASLTSITRDLCQPGLSAVQGGSWHCGSKLSLNSKSRLCHSVAV